MIDLLQRSPVIREADDASTAIFEDYRTRYGDGLKKMMAILLISQLKKLMKVLDLERRLNWLNRERFFLQLKKI